jgi:hypothetical protein
VQIFGQRLPVLYICGLFNHAVHSLDYVASNDMMLDNELVRLLKEMVVYLPGGTEENHKKPQSKQPFSGQDFNLAPPK